ncbi:MAG: recombination protein O N-terminal domain-containing protein [Muribaculaceae bacterium]|nr:recombination protein O N-terminal domain-containing protein [Muribaculaceae bacterium]
MIEKIQGIVLGTVRHSDRHNVVTLYTRSRGRMAVLSAAGTGRTARMRNARLQPMAVIEADIDIRSGRDLPRLGQFAPVRVWREIYFHPVKSSLAMFAAEFLGRLMRDSAPDGVMWDYVLSALGVLDAAPAARLANWHIALLVSLLGFSGIMPDPDTWEPGRWLDMREGRFTAFPPPHADRLDPEGAAVAFSLERMDFLNAPRFRFSREERREVTRQLLRYFSVHFPGVANLRSPEILGEIFDGM